VRKSLAVLLVIVVVFSIVYFVPIEFLINVRSKLNEFIFNITQSSKVSMLEKELERLKVENDLLKAQLNDLQTKYNQLNEKLKYAVFPRNPYLMAQDEINAFLITSINSVSDVSKQFRYSSYDLLVVSVVNYVSSKTYYQPDSSAIKPQVLKEADYWKLGNETLVDLGGDCEDYAVLYYSILKNFNNKTYIILFKNETSGHAFTVSYANGKWYAIDVTYVDTDTNISKLIDVVQKRHGFVNVKYDVLDVNTFIKDMSKEELIKKLNELVT